jgi:hypothetical protein
MKLSAGLLAAALALVAFTPARAAKIEEQISPASAEQEGFTVTAAERENGMVRFTVTRDIAKAHWAGRDATLEVRGEGGTLLATCRLEPERNRAKNTVSYWFDLAKAQVASTVVTVAEIQTAGNKEDGEKLLGGGTFFRIRVAEFARK